MPQHIQFAHTNIIARDWQRLADFYEQVFGCQRLLPERHLTAPWVARATGIAGAEIHGIHLRLPGYGSDGPTLEIFQYHQYQGDGPKYINRPGLAHIAFAVDDVERLREAVLAAGGTEVGEVTHVDIPGAGTIAFVYLADPEGNIIELQHWAH